MSLLSAGQQETLRQVCDTLVPVRGADEHDLASHVEAVLAEVSTTEQQRRFARFLSRLESRVVNAVVAGQWQAFSRLTLDERTAVLRAWSSSRFVPARRAFQAVKRLTMFLAYASRVDGATNLAWDALDYPPPCDAAPADASPRLPLITIDRATTLSADVLVVGSGAGGGVVAARLAEAGQDVLVVEKGAYYHADDFVRDERAGFANLYERRGSLATNDLGVVVLAGSTVGGGTTVNWMTSLATPEEIRDEWSRRFGFRAAASREFERQQSGVLARLEVNTDHSQLNGQNAALERGCRALGYRVEPIPRNAVQCVQCDFCGYGCRYGAKRDARATYLADACGRGARLLANARVDRLLHSAGAATGAVLHVRAADGRTHEVTVRSKIVVLAAGSIHTPAVLLRSGLENRQIGRNLHLHPTTAVFARYAEPVHPWQGPPQTRYCDQFADLDGKRHGVRIEACPAHPGLWAMGLPWQSGDGHKRLMQQLAYMGNLIVIGRDAHGGRVRLDRAGEPVLHYRLHRDDAARLVRGALEALRIQAAAGALEIYSPHNRSLSFEPGGAVGLEDYLRDVHAADLPTNAAGLFSAHQLCSCRIASDRKLGAANPEGRLFELGNVFVADASAMPSPCGVNPMISIMAIADHVSACIASRLR